MGDDDDAKINDDAMRETATTRWVRGHYDETRCDATQQRRHDGGGRWAIRHGRDGCGR